MSMEKKINAASAYSGLSQSATARAVGMSPSNFNQKIKRGTFSEDELARIAEALGASYVAFFEFPDGTRI
jgi:transcriptional regulator with XRE-family HTH domain